MSHWDIELAAGGVIGRDHRLAAKNYQDAYHLLRIEQGTIGVVADGCGSGARSETGAQLGVRLVAEAIRGQLEDRSPRRVINWQRVQQHVLASLDVLARQMGGSYREVIETYFLFTVVGVVITDERTTFFACGDAAVSVNGEPYSIGPFEGNMPPYIGYGLISQNLLIDPASVRISVITELETCALRNFLLGSDGVFDLARAESRLLPGLAATVGPLAQFWQDDRFFRANPALVSRQLGIIARDWPRRDSVPGLLPDDTTIIVGRRRPNDLEANSW